MADDLRDAKLKAEVRKLSAEAEYAELKRDALLRKERISFQNEGPNYVYQFFRDVTEESVDDFCHDLGPWSRAYPGQPITVVLNSPGGAVLDGLALYDELIDLRKRGHHVTMVVRGWAASMGAVLLQAADERVIGRNAHMMIHETSSFLVGKTSEQEESLKFTKMLQSRLLEILAERSSLSPLQVRRRWKGTDWYLGAEEAVSLGFADRVG